jgi:hypothetical protein
MHQIGPVPIYKQKAVSVEKARNTQHHKTMPALRKAPESIKYATISHQKWNDPSHCQTQQMRPLNINFIKTVTPKKGPNRCKHHQQNCSEPVSDPTEKSRIPGDLLRHRRTRQSLETGSIFNEESLIPLGFRGWRFTRVAVLASSERMGFTFGHNRSKDLLQLIGDHIKFVVNLL